MKIDLGGVEETLLVPLWGRAKFSRENPSILNDTKATELVEGLDYDFARLDKSLGVLRKSSCTRHERSISTTRSALISLNIPRRRSLISADRDTRP